MSCATDIRISSDKDETQYDYIRELPSEMPNYPTWRINLGAKITILPTKVYKINDRDILIKKAESRRELFEQIIKEQRETESAEGDPRIISKKSD